eukprot:TRINITY_DN793_c0_g1_i1.p1 TRINITY_DN793_c0_g1~~TRINITY_DN793_c0_g1_i1.p1  ORF type:complete len:209 (+),score=46.52 TRINITY_DN793_c0_g1_i1:487-1113(+)
MGIFCRLHPANPKRTTCTKIILMDPMGSLPTWIVSKVQNRIAASHPKLVAVMQARYANQSFGNKILVSEAKSESSDEFFDVEELDSDSGSGFLFVDVNKSITALVTPSQKENEVGLMVTTYKGRGTILEAITDLENQVESVAEKLKVLEKSDQVVTGSWFNILKFSGGHICLTWFQFLLLLLWPGLSMLLPLLFLGFKTRNKKMLSRA